MPLVLDDGVFFVHKNVYPFCGLFRNILPHKFQNEVKVIKVQLNFIPHADITLLQLIHFVQDIPNCFSHQNQGVIAFIFPPTKK